MQSKSSFGGSVLKVVLGVVIGVVVVRVAFVFLVANQIKQLSAVAESAVQSMGDTTHMQAARRKADRQDALRLKVADQQRTAELIEAQRRADQRKSTAWTSFYQPSAQCLADVTVECGNQHMRAKKEFERRYAAGEF